jgi:hypothetical protein
LVVFVLVDGVVLVVVVELVLLGRVVVHLSGLVIDDTSTSVLDGVGGLKGIHTQYTQLNLKVNSSYFANVRLCTV